MVNNMENEKLLELYNKRSENAIVLSANCFGNYLMRVAYNVLGNYEDSEECVQDAYLKTWNSVPPNQPANLKLYIAKITRNSAIDKLLAKTSEKRGGGQAMLCLDELSECIPSPDLEEEGISEIISAFLRKQDAKKAKLFVRRYWYMDSISDLSVSFNWSQSKVKTTLHRMRSELKEELSKEGIRI